MATPYLVRVRETNRLWAAYIERLLRTRYPNKRGGGNASALARAIDVAPSTISRWRHGGTPEPPHLRRMSEMLGIPIPKLLQHVGFLTEEELTSLGMLGGKGADDIEAYIEAEFGNSPEIAELLRGIVRMARRNRTRADEPPQQRQAEAGSED